MGDLGATHRDIQDSGLDIDTKTDWLMAEKIKINTSQFQEKL